MNDYMLTNKYMHWLNGNILPLVVLGIFIALVLFFGGWHLGDKDWGILEWDDEGGSGDEDSDDFPIVLKVAGLGGIVVAVFAIILLRSQR